MKKELIHELFEKFEQACYNYKNIECWSARDLQTILGYAKWDNFLAVIDKAKISCESSGIAVADHFADIGKMVALGSGSKREIQDIALTRYACYLVAQNGNPGKSEVAFAQTYFVVQTRSRKLLSSGYLILQEFQQEKNSANRRKNFQELSMRGVWMIKGLL